jgi:hypothetical protein
VTLKDHGFVAGGRQDSQDARLTWGRSAGGSPIRRLRCLACSRVRCARSVVAVSRLYRSMRALLLARLS